MNITFTFSLYYSFEPARDQLWQTIFILTIAITIISNCIHFLSLFVFVYLSSLMFNHPNDLNVSDKYVNYFTPTTAVQTTHKYTRAHHEIYILPKKIHHVGLIGRYTKHIMQARECCILLFPLTHRNSKRKCDQTDPRRQDKRQAIRLDDK